MSATIFPPTDGRCGRCGAQDEGDSFCGTCWLQLRAGSTALAGRAALSASGWRLANPELQSAWERRVGQGAEPSVDEAAGAAAEQREAATRDFVYWHQRCSFLLHLMQEAETKASAARDRCLHDGLSDAELRAAVGVDAAELFAVRPASGGPAGRALPGAAGGFAFFYAESGVDVDADGDVDGGLIDTVSGGGDGGGLLDGLGDLFG